MKRSLPLFVIVILITGFFLGCIEKNPAHPLIIEEVRQGLQEEFSEELSNVENMLIFEHTLKIFMVPEWPNDNLGPFAKKATELFGFSMRKHKIRNVSYFVNIYQDKEVEGDMKNNKQIAECYFENSTDRTKVKLLGLGEGKYDVK